MLLIVGSIQPPALLLQLLPGLQQGYIKLYGNIARQYRNDYIAATARAGNSSTFQFFQHCRQAFVNGNKHHRRANTGNI